MVVDGPVIEGGEYFYVHLSDWGSGFSNDRAPEMNVASFRWAEELATRHQGWLVMFVEGGSVHLRHFYDGYPLCWSYEDDGPFEGTGEEEGVDCAECLRFMHE
jgi:hypothetical protein